ncbi:MAG TPA: hypothetical protein QGF05_06530, partial [Dehalococcoidia bacterium]|nr:hypothetical protein [Dehalococcoidia bacterium]
MSVRANDLPSTRRQAATIIGFRDGARNIARIFSYAKQYWRQLALVLLALIATGAFALATPLLLEWVVDTALGADNATNTVDVDETLVLVAALALLGAA